jgi:hypothetical protein
VIEEVGSGEVLDPEDSKLVTLARSAFSRGGGTPAAAVRDDMGRTYVAGSVDLPSLTLSALQSVVAAAVSSGVRRLEVAALATSGELGELADADRAVLADLGGCPVFLVDGQGGIGRTRVVAP